MKRLLVVLIALSIAAAPDPASARESALPPPEITSASIDGNFATIVWRWSFDASDLDLVTFDVKRNGVSLGVAVARAQPYFAGTMLRRGIIDVVPGYGTHTYCVDVRAQSAAGTEVGTACAEVTLEAAAEIVITGGNGLSGRFNRNAANLTLEYQVYESGDLNTNCEWTPGVVVNPSSQILQHNCDPASGRRTLVIRNPARGDPTAFMVSFREGTAALLNWLVSSS